MLAEYLGSHGYATAGFVANTGYCSYDTGLDRGFTHYEDYVLEKLELPSNGCHCRGSRMTVLDLLGIASRRRHCSTPCKNSFSELVRLRYSAGRGIGQSRISRLARPTGVIRRVRSSCFSITLTPIRRTSFPREPSTASVGSPRRRDELRMIYDDWTSIDKLQLPPHYLTLARDCYDNCLAYLDERLGRFV